MESESDRERDERATRKHPPAVLRSKSEGDGEPRKGRTRSTAALARLREINDRDPGGSTDDGSLSDLYRRADQYQRRHGTAATVRFQCENGMPRNDAPGKEWAAYHQAMLSGRAAPLPDVETDSEGYISLDALLEQEEERSGE